MTLIACTSHKETPILIGDILLSSNSLPRQDLPVFPSPWFNISDKLKGLNGYFPTEFSQKIYVVSSTIAIAFAGNVMEMKTLFEDFIMHSKYYNGVMSDEVITNFLQQYPKNAFKESTCLIINITKVGPENLSMNKFILGHWKGSYSVHLKDMYLIGSGIELFEANINVESIYKSLTSELTFSDQINKNIGVIAQFLMIERISLETVHNLWGGFFELIYFNRGSFEKLDDIAYVLSIAPYKKNEDNTIPTPFIILYQKYFDNVLYITSIPIQNSTWKHENGQYTITCVEHQLKYFIVESIIRKPLSQEIFNTKVQQSFRTNQVCIAYLLTRPDNRHLQSSYIDQSDGLVVEFDYGKEIRIKISDEIYNYIKFLQSESPANLGV